MRVIGLMSGTSADGVDAALVDLQGAPPSLQWNLLQHIHHPYPTALQAEILACARAESSIPELCQINFALGEIFAEAALEVITSSGLKPEQIDLIGSHGQTVWHIPSGENSSTLQIGEAAVIAERTGITVIDNFRTRDMAAGGQGAPLTSYTDVLLFTHPTRVRACQNIGGIANLTFLPPASQTQYSPLAFDTGPGNMLLDDAVRYISAGSESFDRDGARAARGQVHKGLLEDWLRQESYFSLRPPKTTGRELFNRAYSEKLRHQAQQRGLTDDDLMATLTALTARSIADAYRNFLPLMPEEIIISGGGALNPVLMDMLRTQLAPARLIPSDELGLPSVAKEATAFAVLAYETWHNRPSSLPSATGARHASVLGSMTPAQNWNTIQHK